MDSISIDTQLSTISSYLYFMCFINSLIMICMYNILNYDIIFLKKKIRFVTIKMY